MDGDKKEKTSKKIEDKYNTRKLKLSSFVKNKYLIGGLLVIIVGGLGYLAFATLTDEDVVYEEPQLTALTAADTYASLRFTDDNTAEEKAAHFVNTANAYKQADEDKLALEYYLLSIEEFVLGSGILVDIADLYAETGDRTNEEKYINEAINYINENLPDPDEPSIIGEYYAVADLYERLGDQEGAREFFEKALASVQQQPDSAEIEALEEDLNRRLGNDEETDAS